MSKKNKNNVYFVYFSGYDPSRAVKGLRLPENLQSPGFPASTSTSVASFPFLSAGAAAETQIFSSKFAARQISIAQVDENNY